MDVAQILELTIQTLNTVEVHGEDNLAAQLGAIRALKTLHASMSQPPAPPEKEGATVTGVNNETPDLENLEVADG